MSQREPAADPESPRSTSAKKREYFPVSYIAWAVVAVGGALFAAFAAWASEGLCEFNCRTGLLRVQLVIAVAGLVPALVLFFALATGRRRLAIMALAIGLIVYVVWGLVNHAAVTG